MNYEIDDLLDELELHIRRISSLTAENYRLRARLQILTGVAVENTTLDALQPKEGE